MAMLKLASDGTGPSSSTSLKKNARSFHFRYLELCRTKNLTPLPDIRNKNKSTTLLEFYGDKFGVSDWLLLGEALRSDQVLQTLNVRLRKSLGAVLENLDTEKKAKLFHQKPVIYTKFVLFGVVDAISNCIVFNKNLQVLSLEGLPLGEKYVEPIAKAMSCNESIKEVSFQRSNITDEGCEVICNTIKYLDNVEVLNLSECGLTSKAAVAVADMIQIQKINRYTVGWQKSLRYQDLDPDTMSGLRTISIARNPAIGDDGAKAIVHVLKEDCWLKTIDMGGCGLTDRTANLIIDCLEVNRDLIEFNVRRNPDISKSLQQNIRAQLSKVEAGDTVNERNGRHNANNADHKPKVTVAQLQEKLKTIEHQLAFERVLRKKVEQRNEKLTDRIIAYKSQQPTESDDNISEEFVVVQDESQTTEEQNDFQNLAFEASNGDLSPLQHRELQQIGPTEHQPQVQLQQHQLEHQNGLDDRTVRGPINEQRKAVKVRKVKSEIKYMDPPVRDPTKKKQSKSDHEFANETDFEMTTVRFETNIGDSTTNNGMALTQQQEIEFKGYEEHKSAPTKRENEMDDLSLSTSRTLTNECCSSDSDTIRNVPDFSQPPEVYIRNQKPQQQQQSKHDHKSPRSLFQGLFDDQ